MRRIALIVVVVLVVVSVAVTMTKRQDNGSSTQTPTAVAKPKIHKTAWDGRAKQLYDVTFIHGAQAIDVATMSYTGLDRPTGNAYVVFTTPKTGTSPPAFVQPLAFHLVSPTGRVWLPKVMPRAVTAQNPPYWQVTLKFERVPSQSLGTGQLTLFISKPGGRFQLTLLPPSPPAGHSFAEKSAVKPKAKAHKKPLCKKHQKSTKKHPCRPRR